MLRATILVLILTATMSTVLFVLKYEVKELEGDLVKVNRSILQTQEDIHVLEAEWAHLNDPARLERLAASHLEMAPLQPKQVVRFTDLPVFEDPVVDDAKILVEATKKTTRKGGRQ